MELLALDLGGGEQLFIEAVQTGEEGAAAPAAARGSVPIDEALAKLQNALGAIGKSGKAFLQTFRGLDTEQASLKLGIAFTTEGSVVIAKAGGAVNFEVTLTWNRPAAIDLASRT